MTNIVNNLSIPGYQIVEQLYTGPRTVVYRAIRNSDFLEVVIKILSAEYPTFSELLQFRNQYTIAKNLNIPNIVCPLGLETYRNGYMLVMEDFGGISLREYIKSLQTGYVVSLEECLIIALQLAETLQVLYSKQYLLHTYLVISQ
ncbi:MAG: serine/threonine-protein kinase [Calothrix sp. FI2-JRJ7]|nr:serine/threonine-protein kinase [Calothrix sp. FI2-JRJ7]